MKSEKIPIRLCMGSSCYARGNDHVLKIINEFLEEHHLLDSVDFRGHLCQGLCNKGPNLSIGETSFNDVSMSSVKMILKDTFISSTE